MKYIKRVGYVLLIMFGLFVGFHSVKAMDDLEGISDYYVDATVEANGDLLVKELIILNGEFNGFRRMIWYKNKDADMFYPNASMFGGSSIHNGSGIDILEVGEIKLPRNNEYSFDSLLNGEKTIFEKNDYADSNGEYLLKKKENGVELKIYNSSRGRRRGFYISYRLKNMGILHNDYGELGWNLFSDELNEFINRMEVKIHLKNNTQELRGWAHGPLQGDISLYGRDEVNVTIHALEANTPMDIRLLFDKNVIMNASKKTEVDALSKILAYEEKMAEEANQEREEYYKELEDNARYYVSRVERTLKIEDYDEAKKCVSFLKDGALKAELGEKLEVIYDKIVKRERFLFFLAFGVSILWDIGLVVLLAIIYFKYDREFQSKFKGEYYREFPATYGPEILEYLMHKKIDGSGMSASILNLIQKQVIAFEEKGKDYVLIYHDTKVELTSSEKKLITWLFTDLGSDNELLLSDLKKKAKKSYQSFLSDYNAWRTLALKEASNEGFFMNTTIPKVIGVIYCVGGFFLFWILRALTSSPLYIFLIIPPMIGAILYLIGFTKRTKKGNEDYTKWIAFKRFLNDFGRFGEKDLPEITLWEKYLVYAVPLGCAKKLSKTMELKIKEFSDQGVSVPGDIMFDMARLHYITSLNTVINHSVNTAMTAAQAARSEAISSSGNSSSGGGFGGGFSSGGGSFGGGGGGGRF